MPNNFNPADFFIKTLAITPGHEENSRQIVRKICDHFVVSEYFKEIDVVVQYEFHMGRAEVVTIEKINRTSTFLLVAFLFSRNIFPLGKICKLCTFKTCKC